MHFADLLDRRPVGEKIAISIKRAFESLKLQTQVTLRHRLELSHYLVAVHWVCQLLRIVASSEAFNENLRLPKQPPKHRQQQNQGPGGSSTEACSGLFPVQGIAASVASRVG